MDGIGKLDFEYLWCIHCQKAYPVREWMESRFQCPTLGCDGMGLFWDAWAWDKRIDEQGIRDRHPEYPEVPVRGVIYPEY